VRRFFTRASSRSYQDSLLQASDMRGFHTAALVALVALALCAGGAADTNTPQTRGAGASNIGTAGARPSLNITTTAERSQGT
jgi:hypothetical protein